MSLNIQLKDKILEVNIEGEINLYNVADYRNEINESLEKELSVETIELNLGKVPYIDSSGIGFLVQLQRKLKNQNKLLRLSKIQNEVFESFKMSSIDSHFNIIE